MHDGKEMKFTQPPGAPPRLYFWPSPELAAWLLDTTRELFIGEGETRAAAVGKHGHLFVAIGGMWNWLCRTADGESVEIGDLDEIAWKGRQATIVVDRDVVRPEKTNLQMAVLRLARALEARGAKASAIIVPDLGDGKTGADDYVAAEGIDRFLALPRRSLDEPEFESWGLRVKEHFTETGNAERFAMLYGDRLRYAHGLGAWLEWDGSRWQPDETERITQYAIRNARALHREAVAQGDADRRASMAKWAMASESGSNISKTLALARSMEALAVRARDLDAHPFLLAVRNGVLGPRERRAAAGTAGVAHHQTGTGRVRPGGALPSSSSRSWSAPSGGTRRWSVT